MLNSLLLYITYISKLLFRKERSLVLHDLRRHCPVRQGKDKIVDFSIDQRKSALEKAVKWLISAQENMEDNGIGSYHLVNGWSSSYPETTGYIIPTLLEYGKLTGNKSIQHNAIAAADWLCEIQKPSGGWPGGRINENKPEIVFNTGQVIRGLLAAYNHTGYKKYLDSGMKAGDWLCKIQHSQGFWRDHALMDTERVYDSYVDAPLILLSRISGKDDYREYAVSNLEWIINNRQRQNGWFDDCDNTMKHNDRPILHTIAYTLDGLIDCGILLDEKKYISKALRPAGVLLEKFLGVNYLHGRYDEDWNGSEYMIVTGCAQMSAVWLKLFDIFKDKKYLEGAVNMNDMLIFIQQRGSSDTKFTKGAMPGSFPIWGKYEPFAFPNWATKFFADALILESEIRAKNA